MATHHVLPHHQLFHRDPNHFDENLDHDLDFDVVQERISETCQLEVALENKTGGGGGGGKLSPSASSKKSNESDCPLLNDKEWKEKKNKRRKQKLPKPLFFANSRQKPKQTDSSAEAEEPVEKTVI